MGTTSKIAPRFDLAPRSASSTRSTTGEWFVEEANFCEGTAYVYLDDGSRNAYFFSER